MQNACLSNKGFKQMATILVLHGPNLNMLGMREPNIYGHETLVIINGQLSTMADRLGHSLSAFQSNAEHSLIDQVQLCKQNQVDFIVLNPAALSHTSIALRDALLAVGTPFVEVHLSNVYHRETFRQQSYFSDIAIGTINGLGAQGYLLALQYADFYLKNKEH